MKLPQLKLFAIRSLTTGKTLPGVFFHAKQDAKADRNFRGAKDHVVTNGPDHRNYRG